MGQALISNVTVISLPVYPSEEQPAPFRRQDACSSRAAASALSDAVEGTSLVTLTPRHSSNSDQRGEEPKDAIQGGALGAGTRQLRCCLHLVAQGCKLSWRHLGSSFPLNQAHAEV